MTEQEIREDERHRIAGIFNEAALQMRSTDPETNGVNPDRVAMLEELADALRTPKDTLINIALHMMADEARTQA